MDRVCEISFYKMDNTCLQNNLTEMFETSKDLQIIIP